MAVESTSPPVGGPVLVPFDRRSEALEAEVAWLEEYWLEARREEPSHGHSVEILDGISG